MTRQEMIKTAKAQRAELDRTKELQIMLIEEHLENLKHYIECEKLKTKANFIQVEHLKRIRATLDEMDHMIELD